MVPDFLKMYHVYSTAVKQPFAMKVTPRHVMLDGSMALIFFINCLLLTRAQDNDAMNNNNKCHTLPSLREFVIQFAARLRQFTNARLKLSSSFISGNATYSAECKIKGARCHRKIGTRLLVCLGCKAAWWLIVRHGGSSIWT